MRTTPQGNTLALVSVLCLINTAGLVRAHWISMAARILVPHLPPFLNQWVELALALIGCDTAPGSLMLNRAESNTKPITGKAGLS